MRRLNRSLLVALSVLAAASVGSPARAVKPGKPEPEVKPCQPFRPNQPPASTRVSLVMPRIHRPSARVITWGEQTVWQPIRHVRNGETNLNRDPYRIELTGYNEGTKVELQLQGKSAPVALPESCPGCASPAPKKLANPEKWARKQRSHAWQKAVAQAQRFRKLDEFTVTVPSHAQTQSEQRADVLPPHTPYKVVARDPFGRKYATLKGNVEGLPYSGERQVTRVVSGHTQVGMYSTGGGHLPSHDVGANTTTENVYITPAYEKNGAIQAKVLGLAAFPAGTKITVTNTRMEGAGEAGHTVSFVASRSGSGSVAVAGLQRDKLRVTVSYDGVPNQAHPASHTFHTRIPMASGRPAFQARGIRYYAVALE